MAQQLQAEVIWSTDVAESDGTEGMVELQAQRERTAELTTQQRRGRPRGATDAGAAVRPAGTRHRRP